MLCCCEAGDCCHWPGSFCNPPSHDHTALGPRSSGSCLWLQGCALHHDFHCLPKPWWVSVRAWKDTEASPSLPGFQGAAEGCRTGVTDAGGDPGHEAGAGHHQHDGRVCQIRQAGEEDQQNDGQAQNSWYLSYGHGHSCELAAHDLLLPWLKGDHLVVYRSSHDSLVSHCCRLSLDPEVLADGPSGPACPPRPSLSALGLGRGTKITQLVLRALCSLRGTPTV